MLKLFFQRERERERERERDYSIILAIASCVYISFANVIETSEVMLLGRNADSKNSLRITHMRTGTHAMSGTDERILS